MRGEHRRPTTSSRNSPGPSPRARGAHPVGLHGRHRRGTIPACAGSTSPSPHRGISGRDHPRVRGEHFVRSFAGVRQQGPSPRARGALPTSVEADVRAGTIPACAGSTAVAPRRWRTGRDHPRVRGEHADHLDRLDDMEGPSPRARGALATALSSRCRSRTIPACAGSTSCVRRPRRAAWDHPRVRREHESARRPPIRTWGPSPRARGAPAQRRCAGGPLGTIPACAGSTNRQDGLLSVHGDHPRVRGEHQLNVAVPEDLLGPSPRARGARQRPGNLPATSSRFSNFSKNRHRPHKPQKTHYSPNDRQPHKQRGTPAHPPPHAGTVPPLSGSPRPPAASPGSPAPTSPAS